MSKLFPAGPVSLPQDTRFKYVPELQRAYERVWRYKEMLIATTQDPLPARWLGHLLREAPFKDAFSKEIIACTDHSRVKDLSDLYLECFLKIFKSPLGPNPPSSSNSPETSFDAGPELPELLPTDVPRDLRQARQLALRRDDYRAVNGVYDYAAPVVVDNPNIEATRTRAAHIIPFIRDSSQKDPIMGRRVNSRSPIAMLQRLGGIAPEDIDGDRINRLSNLITLDVDHHEAFARLDWWLEPITDSGVDNHYKVVSTREIPRLLTEVKFTTTDPLLELPDPRFLAIRAACCRAAHLSGAAG